MDYFSWRICEVNMAPGLLSESPQIQISSAPCEFLLVFPFSFIWIANYSSRSWIRERIFCSNEGRRYRLPPNSPARFHPSDIIEFGSDKKVIYIKHHCYQFGIHFTYNLSCITLSSKLSHFTQELLLLYLLPILQAAFRVKVMKSPPKDAEKMQGDQLLQAV